MENEIRKELESLADENHRIFLSKFIPNIDNVLGVRLPELRKITKRLAKVGYEQYLAATELIYFEEIMLQGMKKNSPFTETKEIKRQNETAVGKSIHTNR